MKQFSALIEEQYHRPELYEDIVERLKNQGTDLRTLSRNDISGVDEFHVRGAEVSMELIKGIDLNNTRILDIGCGIGGPSRMLASEFNCRVTGIDISPEFIRTAKKLTELFGLQDKIEFRRADALDLPFEDESFDVVWTQHVQMNINDKARFYSEIKRVLSNKGTFMYYDIFRRGQNDVDYPVPWANDASVSFLQTTSDMDNILRGLDFTKMESTDQTNSAIHFLSTLFEKLRKNGPPNLGLNLVLGDSTRIKLGNIMKGLEENKLALQSGIYQKA